ncbi:MAG: T9SS type A sorting domain-containing protein [Bacteroidota bacterium]
MKILRTLCLIGWASLVSLSLQAQKKVPHSFQYTANASEVSELKELTQVSYSGTSSIRLYFEEVQLGANSYLLLKGSDGAEQKMDATALKNWSNSSAYFNGQNVKVSLYQAEGEAVTLRISELKVNNKGGSQKASSQDNLATAAQARVEGSTDLPSWSKAVGRFTDGEKTYGTGWIAANGAIVATGNTMGTPKYPASSVNDYDIIMFNIPPSDPDGKVNHAAPEDQYPINKSNIVEQIIKGKKVVDEGGNSVIGNYYIKIKKYAGNKKNYFITEYYILEALPNSTGLRPGERIQEYFQVLDHPNGPTMEDKVLGMFHYGEVLGSSTANQTLQFEVLEAENPRDFVRNVNDKDIYLTYYTHYELNPSSVYWNVHMNGAPITYANTNIALGIHLGGWGTSPSLGLGFRYEGLRQKLSDFFSPDIVHVDAATIVHNQTGEIDKPYGTIWLGKEAVADNGTVSIAKGKYYSGNNGLTIERPMTLIAPVGTVEIGDEWSSARTINSQVPTSWEDYDFSEEEDLLVEESSLKSFPNPFTHQTELHYTLTDDSPVQVKVYDMLGQEVQTLVKEEQLEGDHHLQWDGRNYQGQNMPSGLYIMQLKTGAETSTVRVMKQ